LGVSFPNRPLLLSLILHSSHLPPSLCSLLSWALPFSYHIFSLHVSLSRPFFILLILCYVCFQVARAFPGSQAASLDIEAAYRGTPILPDHKRFLIVMFDDLLYLDHVLPFGLTSTSGLQGEVADTIVDIWDAKGIGPTLKWVDNFCLFCSPSPAGLFLGICDGEVYRYNYDLEHDKSLIADLGTPWHKEKGQPFDDSVEYIGFLWNIPHKSVALIESKRIKYLSRLNLFLSSYHSSHVFKHDAEKVAGTLNHISFVFPFARSFLSPLYQWIAEFPDEHKPCFMRSSVISDLRWWLPLLSSPQPPLSITLPSPPLDLQIWVDASSDFGIGILFDSSWAAWRLIPNWRGPSRDIGWLESLAIEHAAIAIISQGACHSCYLIRSDNEGAIASFRKGRSHNFMSNLCIHHTALITHEASVSLDFLYVPSAKNLADPISQGSFPSLSLALPNPPTLPSSVTPFFLHGRSVGH